MNYRVIWILKIFYFLWNCHACWTKLYISFGNNWIFIISNALFKNSNKLWNIIFTSFLLQSTVVIINTVLEGLGGKEEARGERKAKSVWVQTSLVFKDLADSSDAKLRTQEPLAKCYWWEYVLMLFFTQSTFEINVYIVSLYIFPSN